MDLSFIDGFEEGEVIHYFPNGNKENVFNIKNSKINGLKYLYYETGELDEVD